VLGVQDQNNFVFASLSPYIKFLALMLASIILVHSHPPAAGQENLDRRMSQDAAIWPGSENASARRACPRATGVDTLVGHVHGCLSSTIYPQACFPQWHSSSGP
jgi:hypothetical protein